MFTSVDVKLRLYPQERVLEKLGISAGLGYGRVKSEGADYCDPFLSIQCEAQDKSASAPTFAV